MRCDHCPTRPGIACLGEEARRLCDLCEPRGEHWRRGYARVVATQSAMDRSPRPEPPDEPPMPHGQAPPPPPSYPPGLAAILACPSWESNCHCLDRPAHCRRDGRRTDVPRCLACIEAFPLADRQPDSGRKAVVVP